MTVKVLPKKTAAYVDRWQRSSSLRCSGRVLPCAFFCSLFGQRSVLWGKRKEKLWPRVSVRVFCDWNTLQCLGRSFLNQHGLYRAVWDAFRQHVQDCCFFCSLGSWSNMASAATQPPSAKQKWWLGKWISDSAAGKGLMWANYFKEHTCFNESSCHFSRSCQDFLIKISHLVFGSETESKWKEAGPFHTVAGCRIHEITAAWWFKSAS